MSLRVLPLSLKLMHQTFSVMFLPLLLLFKIRERVEYRVMGLSKVFSLTQAPLHQMHMVLKIVLVKVLLSPL